jgi:hypothetical protein
MPKRRRKQRKGSSTADLAPEYRFDRRRAKPNRFAEALAGDCVAIVLDPDVARVFGDSRRVNVLLRAVIAAVREPGSPKKS